MVTMLFYIDRGDGDQKKPEPTKETKPVSGVLALLACVCTVGISGYVSLRLNDPDQGKVVTLAEMRVRMQREAERIARDPIMPPQAKAMALRALKYSKQLAPYLEHGVTRAAEANPPRRDNP
jgi:hypothetical protein